MKLLTTSVSLALDCSDISKLNLNEDKTSRLIIKTDKSDDTTESVVVLDFGQKHTKHLLNSKLDQQVVFIHGVYQVLKNKQHIPFINIKVQKVIAKNKRDVVDIRGFRNELEKEFETNDLDYLKIKYKEVCCYEEIKGLKKVIESKKCVQLKSQLKTQEISKLKKQKKLIKMQNKAVCI